MVACEQFGPYSTALAYPTHSPSGLPIESSEFW